MAAPPTGTAGRVEVRDPDYSPELQGRLARIEGLWWQLSLTQRTAKEPSAVSLLKISRCRTGALEVNGRSWPRDDARAARRHRRAPARGIRQGGPLAS